MSGDSSLASKNSFAGRAAAAAGNATQVDPERMLQGEQIVETYLSNRVNQIAKHFPDCLGIDDFIARMEMALYGFGFTGDNTIACSNLCRDEVTATLKHKLDAVFGASFNTNGLGGVLTCGTTGLTAGLSHAPIAAGTGKERYVFFSFPHIAIDSTGEVGAISRPGRPGASSACGALKAALGEVQSKGLEANCSQPGAHDAQDPEYSILKQRLARRIRDEGFGEEDVKDLDLVMMTKVAERTITDDLEFLISKTVDPQKADYAVVTGVQIHNWGKSFDDESPNLEFVWPSSIYVVNNGNRTDLDLNTIPGMTPRQIAMLAAAGGNGTGDGEREDDVAGSVAGMTTVRAMDTPYNHDSMQRRRALREQAVNYRMLMEEEGQAGQ
jgi:hypothetical protein